MDFKLFFSATAIYFLTATSANAQMVGGDSDKHGCKGSAGYSWSQLRKECVRIFEGGTTLTAVDPNNSMAAYVFFSPDKKKAEVFVMDNGTKERSVILKKKKNKYVYKSYTLIENTGSYTLLKNAKAIYKSKE